MSFVGSGSWRLLDNRDSLVREGLVSLGAALACCPAAVQLGTEEGALWSPHQGQSPYLAPEPALPD